MHKLNKLHHTLGIYLLTGKIFFHLRKFTKFSFRFQKLFICTIYFIKKNTVRFRWSIKKLPLFFWTTLFRRTKVSESWKVSQRSGRSLGSLLTVSSTKWTSLIFVSGYLTFLSCFYSISRKRGLLLFKVAGL